MIRYFATHNSGGTKLDPYASSKWITLDQMNSSHRDRWPDFPSKLRPDLFVGYNVVVFPDHWVQTRYIGEETAAVKSHNEDTFSLCITGNFTRLGNGIIDTPTDFQLKTLKDIAIALLEKRPESIGLKVLPGTILDINLQRIVPHRTLQAGTDCYGTGLSDTWAREQVMGVYQDKLSALQKLLMQLQDTLKKQRKFGGEEKPCGESDVRG